MNPTAPSNAQEALKREEDFLTKSLLFLGEDADFKSTLRIQRGLSTASPQSEEKVDYVRLDSMSLEPTKIELKALRAFAEARAFNKWADLYLKDPEGYSELFLSPPCVGESLFSGTIVLRKRHPSLGGWMWRDHRDWAWVPAYAEFDHPLCLMALYTLIYHVRDPRVSPDIVYPDRIALWEREFPQQHQAIMAANQAELRG